MPHPVEEQSLTRKTLKILFEESELSETELPGYPDVPIVLCLPEPDQNLLRKTQLLFQASQQDVVKTEDHVFVTTSLHKIATSLDDSRKSNLFS